MFIVSEENVKKIANHQLAYDAMKDAFIAVHKNEGHICPVVIAPGCDVGNSFSIKAGHLTRERLSGLKMGSYWANNQQKGLPNHSTTTILLDEETGIVRAVMNAGYLNGLRTAAADAVATDVLARKDATTLGVLGAGHQAIFEIKALRKIRNIEKILINSRTETRTKAAVNELAKTDIVAEVADTETVCRAADILVTATNATTPLFDPMWINPGTHISAMGADQAGKQELPTSLLHTATLFADLPTQSQAIGEFEMALKENPSLTITAIGAVLTGDAIGRTTDNQITIFDSSGIALQDLSIAATVLTIAVQNGLATNVSF